MESLLAIDQKLTDLLYYQSASANLGQLFNYIAAGFVYLIPVVLIILFFRSHRDRLIASKLFLAVVIGWQVISKLLGEWLYQGYGFRDRPFASTGLTELFFERPEKAFPSDHATVLAVMIVGLFAYRHPKLGWLFLWGGVFSSLARVVIGFHWFGDVLAGWLIGLLAFGLIWLFDRPLTKATEWLFQKFSRSYGRQTL